MTLQWEKHLQWTGNACLQGMWQWLTVLFVFITPGYAPDLMPYLFGDILTISRQQLLWMLLFSVLILLLTGLLFRQLIAVSFDDEFARLRGLPVTTLMIVLMVMNSAINWSGTCC